MCGRFAMDSETNDLIEEFVAAGNDYRDWRISYSIAPTDPVPIVRERDGERRIVAAVWDFRPPFIAPAGRPNFNARIETVNTLGLWKGAFQKARCIVPMRGYYEWTSAIENGEEVKQPHFIHGDGLLAAAGLATARKSEDGAWIVSTSIITREARDASGEVHERMPAFLTEDVWDEWLRGTLETEAEQENMLSLLRDVSGGVVSTITTYPVSRRVNSTRAVDPSDATLIEPIEA